ncbi:YGGT family protein [bacterium BMS3Abin01]|nr:YGGT family protein [bacterium BMS3Abin01]HDZ59232.1 YggT family protein [Actinomycetota bacterium]
MNRPPSDKQDYTEVRRDEGGEYVQQTTEDAAAERMNLIAKINGIIWLLFGILEALIGMRVILKLLEANPYNGFVNFVYDITYPFLAPFFGIVGTPSSNGSVLEASSLIAMLVYLFIAWVITSMIRLIMTPAKVKSTKTYRRS